MRTLQFILLLLYAGIAQAQSARGVWDSRFTLPPGLNGSVYALISQGNNLYVGGAFTRAGNVPANGIARWDGTNWSSLGSGVAGPVFAIAISGTNVYVGGQFHSAGSVSATNIAQWDGTAWHALGGGVDQGGFSAAKVNALYATGTDLYVGGQFSLADGSPVMNIARWDGGGWHDLDSGVYLSEDIFSSPIGDVDAITGDGTNIFVGGIFVQAGGVSATNLASWDGSAWHEIGGCTGGSVEYIFDGNFGSGEVSALTMHSGALFVGGSFTNAGGVAAQNLARWDGTNWQNVGDIVYGNVSSLESYSGSLYVAGNFYGVNCIAATNIAVWTDGIWSALNAQINAPDSISLARHAGGQFYVGGNFSLVNDVSAGNLVRQSGTAWAAIGMGTGNSLSGIASSMASDGTNVYVTGFFGVAGTLAVPQLAIWSGNNWSTSDSLNVAEFGADPNSVAAAGSNIYVSGPFFLPDTNVSGLLYWDGTAWNSLGGVSTAIVGSRLLTVGNVLYVSLFVPSNSPFQDVSLAAWDGMNWTILHNEYEIYSLNENLATDGTNLYTVYATFASNNFEVVAHVARWDGQNFIQIGDIPSFNPSALTVLGTNMYVAGIASTDGSAAIYSWDGTAWQRMSVTFSGGGTITSLVMLRGNLYVGGNFSLINGVTANSLAEWDGSNWMTLGTGVSLDPYGASPGTVNSLVAIGGKLFVGGQFLNAGGIDSGNFAIWTDSPQIGLQNPRRQPGGGFAFDLLGASGDQLEIQTSDALTGWTPLTTVTLTNATQPFTDPSPTNSISRFYRARFVK